MNKLSDISKDFLPNYHKYLTFLKKVYRHELRKNGFRRISTPILENKDLLTKAKQKNGFIIDNLDKDFRQKPYIWIMRSYLENNLNEEIQPIYFYFMEKFFTKTEDWFGEELLIGTEIIWEDDPILDAIQIFVNYKILNSLGLKNKFQIKVNSLWIEKEKVKYKEELVSFYENKRNILTEKSIKLLDEENPIMILESQDEDEKILNENAPKFAAKFLKKDSKEHYKKFIDYLNLLKVPFIEDNSIVTDDENQTKTIWKFNFENGETIAEWYRHNAIAKNIAWIKEIPATWFWLYSDKIVNFLIENNFQIKNKDEIDLFFVWLWDDAKKVILPLSIKAREAWINTVISLGTPSMKEQMLKAQKSGSKFVVMIWIMEAQSWIYQVRNQQDWTQTEVKKDDLIDYIIWKIWQENLNFYTPTCDLIKK